MEYPLKACNILKDTLIFGTSVVKVSWKYTKKAVAVEHPQPLGTAGDEDIKTKYQRYYEIEKDCAEIDLVPMWDFFPHWGSTSPGDIEQMPGCAHRVWFSSRRYWYL